MVRISQTYFGAPPILLTRFYGELRRATSLSNRRHGVNEWIGKDIKRISSAFEPLEGRRDVLGSPNLDWRNPQAESASRRLNFVNLGNGGRIVGALCTRPNSVMNFVVAREAVEPVCEAARV
jgi:hypothetical protein